MFGPLPEALSIALTKKTLMPEKKTVLIVNDAGKTITTFGNALPKKIPRVPNFLYYPRKRPPVPKSPLSNPCRKAITLSKPLFALFYKPE
ncbi:hypothetical protein GGTG_02114 [Gaeumannomyces tritici R3-111a-1]|uniref:Uncharacterized protein n=1 Tax=Gaeumannomyces tritici (strain R3-111a-1) TaxID=644352 RepID=J3NLG5_GAET3|nr:hypothetical protein GGTG_02114 [Gaeumannomyces tritici R3-111a-1]EJT82140.1 hypothetical protein GGTG_02114 [Gaeumannomyces tritici R3-111a-1]